MAATAALVLVAAVTVVALWRGRPGPPDRQTPPHSPYIVTIVASGLPAVDNLVMGDDGALYATLELPAPQGRVVRMSATGVTTVLDNLDRPDGLLYAEDRLYVTEEVRNGRILELDPVTGALRTLTRLTNPEGIGLLPDGALAVSEDIFLKPGRVVRVRREDGGVTPIATGLTRPEGLAVAPDDSDSSGILVAETGTGRILRLHGGRAEVMVDGLTEPDQVAFAPDGTVWITEDADPGRVLRLKDGRLTVVAVLNRPQGMAFLRDGRVLVAEQGAGRILQITTTGDPAAP